MVIFREREASGTEVGNDSLHDLSFLILDERGTFSCRSNGKEKLFKRSSPATPRGSAGIDEP